VGTPTTDKWIGDNTDHRRVIGDNTDHRRVVGGTPTTEKRTQVVGGDTNHGQKEHKWLVGTPTTDKENYTSSFSIFRTPNSGGTNHVQRTQVVGGDTNHGEKLYILFFDIPNT
jgi:hypothetical protein